MKVLVFALLFSIISPAKSEQEAILLHPIFDRYYMCAEHEAGVMPELGDALGTDCFIAKSVKEDGRQWLRTYKNQGRDNKDWYGWAIESQFGEASDASRFANLANGDFKMILAEDHDVTEPSNKPVTYLTKGKIMLYFQTKDVDASFAKIKNGSHVVVKPENNHWGTRWFVVEDPDGNQFAWQGPKK